MTGLVLLAAMLHGSVVPLGLRHAHAGGDVAHDHREQHAHEHSSDGHHGHGHKHHSTDGHGVNVEALESSPIAHVHIGFGFLELMLPVHDEAEADDDEESVYAVRLIGDCLPVSINGPLESTAVISFLTPSEVSDQRGTPCAISTAPHTAVLLCDVARHERSGVQLF